jgi:imidazolonepropionase-like amidohydrolase
MKMQWLSKVRICLLLAVFMGLHLASFAQSDSDAKSPATFTYAIKNATIVQGPGRVMEGGTVLIKDGLITAVGKSVNIPVGAYQIDGTGMYVYPGFIDGFSQVGVKRAENPERPRDLKPSDPPNEFAGITPQNHVRDYLEPSSKGFDDMRKAGFTAGQVAPNGRMLPGKSAVILFSDKPHADHLIVKNDVAMFAQLTGAQGVYPSTVIAVMSKWRELYKNAELSMANERLYASNAANKARPVKDRVLEAFYPVVSKQQPVVFHTPNQLDMRRALALQSETGFRIILTNVKQGWGMEDAIKKANASVLLSLELPEEKKPSDKEVSAEIKGREEKRVEAYANYVQFPAAYEKAGIKFAFSTVSTSPSAIKKNIKTLIDNGLSENAALAALTTVPAEMLGVSGMMGTVDAGKIGNIIVTTAPYFNEESDVKFAFVEGNMFEYEPRPARRPDAANNGAASAASASVNVTGKWEYTAETPMGASDGTMTITKNGDEYGGTMTFGMAGANNQLPLRDVVVEGNSLRFAVMIEMGGQSISLRINGTVEGDNFRGTMDTGNFGSFNLRAKKIE